MIQHKQLHVVRGRDAQSVSFGPRQIEWLLDREIIQPAKESHPEWNLYDAPLLTAMELHDRVWAQPSLRECDFCRVVPAEWEVPCRPFKVEHRAQTGPMGGDKRPVVCCDQCVEMVRKNQKEKLIDRTMTAAIKAARLQGGYLETVVATHSDIELRQHLMGYVKQVVYGMFHNRRGFPERGQFPKEGS